MAQRMDLLALHEMAMANAEPKLIPARVASWRADITSLQSNGDGESYGLSGWGAGEGNRVWCGVRGAGRGGTRAM
jgi:hypothetical protein